jgi:predicted lipoprotein with Yx(FWY)xxD motif
VNKRKSKNWGWYYNRYMKKAKKRFALEGALGVVIIIFAVWYWMTYLRTQTPETSNASPAGEAIAAPNSSTYAYVPGNLLIGTNGNKELGNYLIGSNGWTLYTYAKDAPGVSNCSGECAAQWPPYTVAPGDDALNNIQKEIIEGKVGTITRADGSLQVTYNDAPLYFNIHDSAMGDVNGQNAGDAWLIARP